MKVELREEFGSLVVAASKRVVEDGVERNIELCMRIQPTDFELLRKQLERMGAETTDGVVSIA